MNKYQKELLRRCEIYCFKAASKRSEIDKDGDWVEFKQNPDISIGDYSIDVLTRTARSAIAYLEWIIDGKATRSELAVGLVPELEGEFPHSPSPSFPFRDEKKRPSEVVLHFVNDLADPLRVSFRYTNADDEAYARQVAARKKEEDALSIGLQIKAGDNVLNAFFRKASEDVAEVAVRLEARIESYRNVYENYLVEEKKIKDGATFASFAGLAPGKFTVTVEEVAKDGRLIAKSSKDAELKDTAYCGKPNNVIR